MLSCIVVFATHVEQYGKFFFFAIQHAMVYDVTLMMVMHTRDVLY